MIGDERPVPGPEEALESPDLSSPVTNLFAVDWFEIAVRGVDGEGVEAVWEVMNRLGHGGAVIEDVRATVDSTVYEPQPLAVKAYIAADDQAGATLQALCEALWHLGMLYPIPEPTIRRLAQQDWADVWKAYYHRQAVGEQLVIVPAWDETGAAEGEIVVRLDPGMAFGTGTHPSTQLCLRLLERVLTPGARVLDVGTGSGILAIAAVQLGAGAVKAVDTDPVAIAALEENAALNELSGRIETAVGSVERFAGPFDLILINILAEVIAQLLPEAAARLAAGGTIILSGIIDVRAPIVQAALEACGLVVVERETIKDWVGLAVSWGPDAPLLSRP
ncbi:MAG: 50S ribosomal protein L11 methyltransferase [Ardenticatenaceae bacterium]|nr:50S ribosomal protein L11 methyltransferase [Ardenticatenaceae bacterium]HBY93551.1 50S ribosomal protein L11 methyltransferase [Chloroflexota bacterium]